MALLIAGAGSHELPIASQTGDLKYALAKYIEVDFKEVTTAKAGAICKNQELTRIIGEMTSGERLLLHYLSGTHTE